MSREGIERATGRQWPITAASVLWQQDCEGHCRKTVMLTKTLNAGRRTLTALSLNPMSVKTGQVLTVTIQWDNGAVIHWLRGVFTQSACSSWSGRNRAGFITIIPFLALSLQLYDLKEWLDPLTFTLLFFFPLADIYHISLTFREIEFLTARLFSQTSLNQMTYGFHCNAWLRI